MTRAIALFSGGLDSILACRLVARQGIDVTAIKFVTPFFDYHLLHDPDYPPRMMEKGIEGYATMRFVVDTTGQVDGSQIEVPRTVHRLFAAAVKAALLRSRYFPAMLGGRRVAQLVEQEFTFRMVP